MDDTDWLQNTRPMLKALARQAKVLAAKYPVVCTNPPYLNKIEGRLKTFVTENYKDYSGDLFSVFIYRNLMFCKQDGYCGYMTPNVWMFIKTYEKLRNYIINGKSIVSLIQMAKGAFFKEATVDVCTFVLKNTKENEKGLYFRLEDFKGGMEVQQQKVLEALADKNCGYFYEADQSNFSKIPGSPVAYWASEAVLECYKNNSIYDYAKPCKGIDTGDNNIFLRFWYEISEVKRFLPKGNPCCTENFLHLKWFPYNKGGDYRRWYGNNEYVLNWEENGSKLRQFRGSNLRNKDSYFEQGITWSTVTSGKSSFRFFTFGFLFDNGGSCLFANKHLLYIQGLLNSCVSQELLSIQPTLNNQPGTIGTIPLLLSSDETIVDSFAKQNIALSKDDWDSYETSWDFKRNPLV